MEVGHFKKMLWYSLFVHQSFAYVLFFIFSCDHCKSRENMETMFVYNFDGKTKSIMILFEADYEKWFLKKIYIFN